MISRLIKANGLNRRNFPYQKGRKKQYKCAKEKREHIEHKDIEQVKVDRNLFNVISVFRQGNKAKLLLKQAKRDANQISPKRARAIQ